MGKDLERKSSAITLSDMEIFVFPELMYSLVISNIMSPRIWRWRVNPWFAGIGNMNHYQRIQRVKQYIMDNYVFNLDLETWGLTTKDKELARFGNFISEEVLRNSNALFGYEGDKYYFDMDIRAQFGLDKYGDNVIPYWKTETVEAMDAFRFKVNCATGAGECVSLSALYAAALFIVAGIPLKDIYMMATPLHSQNFIDIDDGILTNNRRLVTKNMWYNGTKLSAQARRALENERVTIVAHESGFVHTIYKTATIDPNAYTHFIRRLESYLTTTLTDDIIVNFLRQQCDIQKHFQLKWPLLGVDYYIPAERAYAYERNNPYKVNRKTRPKLMEKINSEEFQRYPFTRRIVLNKIEDFVRQNQVRFDMPQDLSSLQSLFSVDGLEAETVVKNLASFCHIAPDLPDPEAKKFVRREEPLGINLGMTREEIIDRLEDIRGRIETVDMAFYAYRDLNRTEPLPFLLAAMERNPVSVEGTRTLDDAAIVQMIMAIPDESIYDEAGRLAQPDEVWNYGRGDGVEKALLIANILRQRLPLEEISITAHSDIVMLNLGNATYTFKSRKGLKEQVWRLSPLLEVEYLISSHFSLQQPSAC